MVAIGVVILAAGIGKRMNSTTPKQFLELLKKPILIHSLEVFEQHPLISQISVVTNEASYNHVEHLIQKYHLKKVKRIVMGGKERQNSVYAGVTATPTEWVLVHDAVRAFVTADEITTLIQAVNENQPAATLAVPVKDTIKRVNEFGIVEETLNRKELWIIQTPQMFDRELLLGAHQRAESQDVLATDDAMLVEMLGDSVKVVRGEYTNIKITTPDDIFLGEAILAKRRKGSVQTT
ncbi:2-C-methyl-D-erythritol 4-phosphate cytidylyltransferase [Shimazuella sp. AN120528]|uniref:2-C-methyl-D-erythritol 4-phosphate cytidylyltransferase n=1 Tax=Shimazuella soli TaxID=1892854 RepID=UPI001F0D2CEE|nr:2-C-methyl-D-erythritol 4-phosphate cytidylyltransferase [Shimazuella soli]MCH5585908.1 2-C-methyl-D-erythritol 4-phosphate cytidylyltransferase [Shimazuella soli]